MQQINVTTVAGVVLGFQVAAFSWRVTRETAMGDKKDITWLPPADIINLSSMIVLVCGVFLLPILGLGTSRTSSFSLGLGFLLFTGYPFALAGHYDMYNRKTKRSFLYAPVQEKVATTIIILCAVAFCLLWWRAP